MTTPGAPDCALSGPAPYHCEGCDLSGRVLKGKDLRGANLRHTTLLGTDFRGTVLDGADLTGASIGEGTDFSGCDLTRTVFGPGSQLGNNAANPTRLRAARLPYAVLGPSWQALDLALATIVDMPAEIVGFRVVQCDVSGLDFSNKTLTNAHFLGVVAQHTIFGAARLDNAVFGQDANARPCDLSGARFNGAHLPFAVFDTATLSGADFSNAQPLTEATFVNARMDGTCFDHTDLTSCQFSSPPWWSKQPGHNTSFKSARLNLSTIGKVWSCLDLTGATVVGLVPGVDLSYLQARHAVLSGMTLNGYTLNHADFTGATLTGTQFADTQMDHAALQGVSGELPVFDRAVLTWAQFDARADGDGAVTPSRLRGVSFNGARLQHAVLSDADFSPAGPGADGEADFRLAQMDSVTAARTNFTGARLSGGISMHGASFVDATLARADMSGAVLGALNKIFTIAASDSPFETFRSLLNAADGAGVAGIFNARGNAALGPQTTVTVTVADRAWRVNDGAAAYTVLFVVAADGTQSLQAFGQADKAVLSGAFMPDAILNDANLIGVSADGIQLFPTREGNQLQGAIMFGIDLSNAILGADVSINISGANLINADMSGAFLLNADLSKSNLSGANLSRAQLQGADFTDTVLTGTNLADAAVAIVLLPPAQGTGIPGVALFEVPASQPLHDAALAELRLLAALDDDGLPLYPWALAADTDTGYAGLLAGLNAGQPGGVAALLGRQGVSLAPTTQVQDHGDARGAVWRLIPPQGQAYTVWVGLDAETLGLHRLYAQPDAARLRECLRTGGIELRWQATISAPPGNDGTQAWLIDNNSSNPLDLQAGYVQFFVQLQRGALAVYGTLIHATRLGRIGQLEMHPFSFQATRLCKNPPCDPQQGSYLQADTLCPNGARLAANQLSHKSWAQMMQASASTPLPPPCVPSPYAPCQQAAAAGSVGSAAALAARRRPLKPTTPSPSNASAQAAGSGTADGVA